MGCNLFILAQKEFDYFLPPVGAKIPVLHLELLQVAHILPFFILFLFFHCCLYLSYLLSIPSLDAGVNTSSLEYAQDLYLTSLLILNQALPLSRQKYVVL